MDINTMFRRKSLWVTVISVAVVTAVLAAGLWVWQSNKPHGQAISDCAVARSMIDYNTAQSQSLAKQFDPEQRRQPGAGDYQAWADQMHGYAVRIHDPDVAGPAHRLADDANKMVDLVKQVRSDASAPADPSAPPSWVQPYADLTKQFNTDLTALDSACTKQ